MKISCDLGFIFKGGLTGFSRGGNLPRSSLTGYPSLSINYVHMSKDVGKRLPQLYYIKMKISCDLGFIFKGGLTGFSRGGNLPRSSLTGYPSLSINYVHMSKDVGKRLPQLYYIKTKISYDLGFIAIGVAMAT